jgi:outer membrane biosynthesis protein TonB
VKNLERFGSPAVEELPPPERLTETVSDEKPETRADITPSDVASPAVSPDVAQQQQNVAKDALMSLLDDITVAVERNATPETQDESEPTRPVVETGDNADSASRTLFRYDIEFSSDRFGDPAFDAMANPVAVYLKDLRRRLETEWFNRMNAIDRFAWPQGELVVQITITKEGDIKDILLLQTTGSIPTKYISATLESIEPNRRYKPFPVTLSGDSITITMRYSF